MNTATTFAEAAQLRALLATDRRDLRALLGRSRKSGPHTGRDQCIVDLRGRIQRNDLRLQALEAAEGLPAGAASLPNAWQPRWAAGDATGGVRMPG